MKEFWAGNQSFHEIKKKKKIQKAYLDQDGMLSQKQKEHFKDKGFIRIKGAFSKESAAKMEEKVWEELYRLNSIKSTEPKTWNIIQATKLQDIKKDPVFDPIGGTATIEAIDDLLGEGKWQGPSNWGQFLVTFPTKDTEWTVPHSIWHTDFGYEKSPDILQGLLFTSFISSVKQRSGGTAFIEASHRIVEKFVRKQSQKFLEDMRKARLKLIQSEPWLLELITDDGRSDRLERFMETTTLVSDVPVKVREMTGEPGDIIIGHPWLLHTPALNCGDYPRMMRVQRIRVAEMNG